MTYDFIIVGQGLAGSVLCLSLRQRGYTVYMIDDPGLSSCSHTAAGIWNPIVFKRLTKSWLADDLVPGLERFYTYAEKLLNIKLLYKRPIIKPFTEQQEKNLWIKKAEGGNLFLDPVVYKNFMLTEKNVTAEYARVLNAGNMDVKLFLKTTTAHLISFGCYLKEHFDHCLLENNQDHVMYKSVSAKRIVFCEGHLVSKNPFFNHIPLKPAKGELLTIYCEDLLLKNEIYNKGIFILPISEHTYKIGATYEWELLNDLPTEKAKAELIHKLESIITLPYKIIQQEAGIRPAVIDRRPVIGSHPQFSNYFIFNGFGTKAVMLAPYFAEKFCQYVSSQQPLHPEVDSRRFERNLKEALIIWMPN